LYDFHRPTLDLMSRVNPKSNIMTSHRSNVITFIDTRKDQGCVVLKYFYSVAVMVFLSGCVSMLTHVSYSEDDIRRSAETVAMLERCAARGIVEEQDVDAFKSAFAQLLTVSTYNHEVYAQTYESSRQEFLLRPPSNLQARCREFGSIAPQAIQALNAKYDQISRERRRDLVGVAGQASAFQVPNYGAYAPQQSAVQPNFGYQQPKTSHYLIDAGQGQRLCSISPSGVARCQ